MNILACNKSSKTINDKELFQELSFGLEYGEKVGMIGPNGTGKSTLHKIISGLVDADGGEITFNKGIRI